MLHRVLGLLALIVLAAPAASAQELRGTVRGSGDAPAVGVIIEATDLGTGARVANTLTDARGYFILRLPADALVRVRALRIGQRPTVFGEYQLAQGETRTEQLSLSGTSIVLERIDVVSRTVCSSMRDTGQVVATLYGEVRKALEATKLTSTQGQLTAEWVLTNQLTALTGDPIGTAEQRAFRGTTDRPFVSLPADSLARVGYLEAVDETYTYFAPDAEVLLSEAFVLGHCFQAVPWRADDRDWVGVQFRPAESRRRVVGIEGTLWLERTSAELKRLEYRYVNLPREVSGAPAGGDVEFLRLPSGAWLVQRWSIRMPKPTEFQEPIFRAGRQVGTSKVRRLRSFEVAGGEVREIKAGEQVLFVADGAGVVRAVERSASLVASLCPVPPSQKEGVLYGTVRDSAGQALPDVDIAVEWPQNARWIAEWQRAWETRRATTRSAADGFWFVCGVPRGEPLRIIATVGGEAQRAVASRLVAEVDGVETNVVVGLGLVDGVVGTVYGVAFDSLRSGGPWRGAEVRVLGGSQRAVTDSTGRFTLDSLPPGEHLVEILDDDLTLLRVSAPVIRVQVGAAGDSEAARIGTPSPDTYFAQVCGRARRDGEGVLIGEVRDLASARRSGLKVQARWLRTLMSRDSIERDEHLVEAQAAADGSFLLCGVPLDGEASKSGDVTVYASGEITLQAGTEALGSDGIAVRMNGVALRRRDLIVGSATDRGRISGRVRDQIGRPIAEATVLVGGVGGISTRSDSLGRWALDGVPVRSTTLTVRALGYAPFERTLDPVSGRLTGGEIRLEPAPQVLAANVTTATGGSGPQAYRAAFEERKRAYAFGTFVDDEAIARQPVVNQGWLRSQIPKTRLGTHRVLVGRQKIGFEVDKGFGAMDLCFPRWFIDGVDFGIPEAEEEERWLRSAKRVEAYKANLAPAQFNDFDGCGVILVWTR